MKNKIKPSEVFAIFIGSFLFITPAQMGELYSKYPGIFSYYYKRHDKLTRKEDKACFRNREVIPHVSKLFRL